MANITPVERKKKVAELYVEHKPYLDREKIQHPLFIPKMAYRPTGKDDLYISFFPSELQKSEDIYTEFVSIAYDSEDPKRTLYYLKHNPHWSEEYELITSNSGFERYIVPVSELKVLNDVNSRQPVQDTKLKQDMKILTTKEVVLKDPEKDRDIVDVLKGIEKALLSINQKLK
tara:strand:- start:1546 stop:2064 length:519 start_codon:yes stop_codon:yes gene_type:complete